MDVWKFEWYVEDVKFKVMVVFDMYYDEVRECILERKRIEYIV